MRSGVVIVAAVFALVAAAAILVYAVDIDVTDSGEMPTAEVNVDVKRWMAQVRRLSPDGRLCGAADAGKRR